MTDSLIGADGKPFKLEFPRGDELPQKGFDAGEDTFVPVPLFSPALSVGLLSSLVVIFLPFSSSSSRSSLWPPAGSRRRPPRAQA